MRWLCKVIGCGVYWFCFFILKLPVLIRLLGLKILLFFNILLKNIPKCGIVVVSKSYSHPKRRKEMKKRSAFLPLV